PPGAALFMAKLVGCRLPTSGEMRAAISIELGGQPIETYIQQVSPNLRDQTWEAYRVHIDALTKGPLTLRPDKRAAHAGSFDWAQRDTAPARAGYTDGVAWFLSVPQGRGRTFKDVIGNV